MARKTYYLPDIVAHFKQNGLKVLGQGYHAAVFQSRKTNEVLKVFRNDKCYVRFLKIIAEHPSVHFPRIKSYVPLRGDYDAYHIVKMEKLTNTLAYLGPDQILLQNIQELSGCYYQLNKGRSSDYLTNTMKTLEPFIKENPSLCEALKTLAEQLNMTICDWDFKAENIMRRDDGTIVIIDPFASFG